MVVVTILFREKPINYRMTLWAPIFSGQSHICEFEYCGVLLCLHLPTGYNSLNWSYEHHAWWAKEDQWGTDGADEANAISEVRIGPNAGAADGRQGINNRNIKTLEVASADKNNQRILMEVLGRREHMASSPGMGGTLARRYRIYKTNNGQRHLQNDCTN